MLRIILAIVFLVQLACAENHFESAWQKAKRMDLAGSRYWHLLLHMQHGVSEIDSPDFFLSDDGATNAAAELEATLFSLYHDSKDDDNATGCRYPARRHWLEKTLDLQDLPQVNCEAFDTLVEKMDPQSVTLIFSAAHINSPASMFGHTFLRIDTSIDSKMLSSAINYAASADPEKENGVVFAIKGLVGGYPGVYSLLPYYEKLKEYRDTEQRNVWEYNLNLDHEEVMAMVRHIWELRISYNWYYFFDENCSYSMLWLLEVARPGVHLRDHFVYHIIPMETVHAAEAEGIVAAKHFRPSKRTLLLAYESVLDASAIDDVKQLTSGEKNGGDILKTVQYTKQQKQYILEAAAELIQYHLMKAKVAHEDYLTRYHDILSTRALLGKAEPVPVKTPINPDQGHRATRMALGSGWRDGLPMQILGIRPAYHDLGDSDIGFMKGTQIEFLDLLARYDDAGIALEKATIVSIVSLAPVSRFFSPFSWRMHAGWDQESYARETAFSASVGAGLSTSNDHSYGYLLAEPEYFIGHTGVAAIKATAGGLVDTGAGSKLLFEGGYRLYSDGHRQWVANAMQTIRVTQNNAVKLSFDYLDKVHAPQRTFMVAFHHYY